MGKKKEAWVIVVHKYHFADDKKGHAVDWKSPRSKRAQQKRFTRLSEAKRFAVKKSRSLKLKSYTDDASKVDPFEVKVSKKPQKKKKKKRSSRKQGLFDLNLPRMPW